MKKNQSGFSAVEALLTLIVAGLTGIAGWYIWQRPSEQPSLPSQNQTVNKNQEQASDCADIENHSERYACYSNDSDAQLLRRAIAEKKPELCDDIDHVFTPHDVQGDINKGIIGTIVDGDEAKQDCREYVQRGHGPRSG